MNIEHLVEAAIQHQRRGRLEDAAAIYQQVLQSEPDNHQALHLLGLIEYQFGDDESAISLLRQAVDRDPRQSMIHNSLGLALHRNGQLEEAVARFQRAIELAPDSAQPYNNLGILFRDQGSFERAFEAYQKALELNPNHVGAQFNLGNAQRDAGDAPGAAESYRRAIELVPNFGMAFGCLGAVLLEMSKPSEAEPVLRKAYELLPDDPVVNCDLGAVLLTRGRHAEAIERYERAVTLDASIGRAWYGLGCAQTELKKYADAIDSFRRTLQIDAEHAESHHNLARALYEMGEIDSGIDHFRRATSLGLKTLPLEAIATMIPGAPSANNQTILQVRQLWADRFAAPNEPAPTFASRSRDPERCLRIGYVSAFFARHNWMKPVWGLINNHDRDNFEIHLFSDAAESEIQYGYAKRPEDRFHDTSKLANPELADLIQGQEIDILVDLNGYSCLNRLPLMASRPAPVIVAWFNMYATSGMKCFDYLIGDEHVAPAEEDAFYTEQVIRLPVSYLTFELNYPVPNVAPAPCLSNGYVTFGSLASQYKITPAVIDAWAQILRGCPNSKLLLKNAALADDGNRSYVHDRFDKLGIEGDRILLEGPADHFAFLETYNDIDAALDTFPYNGGTTTMEAIWQGVPVLTFYGDRWASRTSATILRNAALEHLVAGDVDRYIQQAIRLGSDPQSSHKLKETRMKMRPGLLQVSIVNVQRLAESMESQYRAIWRRW